MNTRITANRLQQHLWHLYDDQYVALYCDLGGNWPRQTALQKISPGLHAIGPLLRISWNSNRKYSACTMHDGKYNAGDAKIRCREKKDMPQYAAPAARS